MLSGIRVLELSAPETMLGGQILGDLGADVIVVETPGGAAGRRIEPFLDDKPGLDRSLTWHALNRNKRGITLNLDTDDGRDVFRRLASQADIVLQVASRSAPVEVPDTAINCRLTPFAEGSPKFSYLTSDLIYMAASGAPGGAGDPDRPPLFFPFPQSIVEAGAEAAVAALAALAARDRHGVAQEAGLSVRVAALFSSMSRTLVGISGDAIDKRGDAQVLFPSIYDCADGYMLVSITKTKTLIHLTRGIARWLADDGHYPRELAEIDWANVDALIAAKAVPEQTLSDLIVAVERGCLGKTKAELVAISHKYGFMAAPVATMKDIHDSIQFIQRGFFAEAPLPGDGRTVRYPLRFAQFSNHRIELRRPAPLLSEHSCEVLEAIGFSAPEIQALFVHGVI